MRHRVAAAGLQDAIVIESAGTGSWHIGHPPDARASAEARARGVEMTGRARQFHSGDVARPAVIAFADGRTLADLRALAPDPTSASRVRLLREFAPTATGDLSVPDPYYGGIDGFTDVFDMVDRACQGLLEHLRAGMPAGA